MKIPWPSPETSASSATYCWLNNQTANFADTIARQYFIDAWHVALFTRLMESRDPQLAAISAKSKLKEARYHLRF